MKNIFLKVSAAVSLSAVLLTGCIKETFPQGATRTAPQVSGSEGALAAMANAIPAAMMGFNVLGYYSTYEVHWDHGIGCMQIAWENMCEDWAVLGDNPYYSRFYPWSMNANQGERYIYCAYFWDGYYTWIKGANDIITSVIPESATDIAKIYLGQAYAYRASFYLDLARLYEPKDPGEVYANYDISKVKGLTVPIINEKSKEKDAFNNPRVTHKVMYDFILSDLEKAESYLSGKTIPYTQPSINVVYGLMARAYLEMGSCGDEGAYEKAAEYAGKVISESGKTPLTKDQWTDPKTGFSDGSANNAWIWGLPMSSEIAESILTPTSHKSPEASWGYAPLSQPGLNKATYDKISDNDWRKLSWLDPDFKSHPERYRFVKGDGSDFINKKGAYEACLVPKPLQGIKFRPAKGEVLDDAVGNTADLVLMRIEEMYFIKAEAEACLDKLGDAKTTLESLIKTRNASYSCSAASKEDFLEEMLLQKRIEFWGEGITVFDYKRLGHSITRGYTGTNHPEDYALNCEGRSPQLNFVITRAEFQSNKGVTTELNNPDPSNLLHEWTAATE